MNCFASCNNKDILEAKGLKITDLFSEAANRPITSKPQSVEYIYSDKLKKVRFYKWNKDKNEWYKCFCWKHKDKNGLWLSGKGNNKIPLYNQNKLSSAEKETVYIVEGEKDADTMSKLDLIAVSAPNGATKGNSVNKWNSDYNSLFKNLNVAVIPDND